MGKRKKKRKFRLKPKPQIERVCGNCKLYDPQSSQCKVTVLFEGKRINLPVLPNEPCFFEEDYFDEKTGAADNFVDDLQEVKFWVENDKGEKTGGDGTVKMECPEDYFGKDMKDVLG
jgi:hypothetical protein